MAFDPDAFLAGGAAVAEPPAFDPDAFLKGDSAPAFDPDAFLSDSSPATTAPTPQTSPDRAEEIASAGAPHVAALQPDPSAALSTDQLSALDAEREASDSRLQELTKTTNLGTGALDVVEHPVKTAEGLLEFGQLAREASGMTTPMGELPKPRNTGVGTGVIRGVESTAEGLFTPENILLMGALGGAPTAIQKLAGAGFGAAMIKGGIDQIMEASNAATPGERAEGYTKAVLSLLLGGLAAKHGVGESRLTAPERLQAQADAVTAKALNETGSPLTAEAVIQTTKPNEQTQSSSPETRPPAAGNPDAQLPPAGPDASRLETGNEPGRPAEEGRGAGVSVPAAEGRVTNAGATEPQPPSAPTTLEAPAPVEAKSAPEPVENDWTKATLPDLTEKPSTAPVEKAGAQLGILPPGFADLLKTVDLVKTGAKKIAAAVTDIPAFHDFRKSVLDWSARNQAASGEVFKAAKDILASVPDKTRREAITNWIQAAGDKTVLADRAANSIDLKRKLGYRAALNLTPAEVALAGKIRQTYDILLKRAEANGIEISEIENYVNQIWKRQPLKEFAASSNRNLSTSIRFAKQRYYNSFFEGEQAGLKPQTKDIGKLLPIYMNEVNNAIAAKQLVAKLSKGKATDGRPLLAPAGGAKTIDAADGGKAHLVFPDMRNVETRDYVQVEQPALHGWRWKGEDETGNPIMVKSDLLVHPEVAGRFKNILGQSALREWYRSSSENPLADIPKAAVKFLVDDVQQIAKATMLGFLSPFHQVQEGTHAIGHRVNPFGGIPKIDLTQPAQLDAAQHGLMLLPDRVSAQQFREGLDGSSRNIVANLIGAAGKPGATIKGWADSYQDYLFHQYIPGLKLKTYEHILDRNSKRYVDELASGQVTMDQVKYLSAQQSNAAYGHLNYADIARNPTIQHIAQALLLAPDFLEARTRFAGQAVRGAVSKVGREQLAALATLAVTQFVLARVLNKTTDDDYHWDKPFSVVHGNREYTMRSVPEDIYKAFSDTRKFASGRLSPVVGRGLLEGLSGVNYRGEPTTIGETFTNIIGNAVPLTLQPATRGLSETSKDNPVSPIEQLIGSLGLHVSRFSPVSEIYHLSKDWTEKHGKEYGLDQRRGVFPRSQYQQLRYALEDSNSTQAKAEVAKLLDSEKITRDELGKRFKESINRPFTGSQKTDEAFKKSLDDRGKRIFDAAVKRRELLLQRFGDYR